MVKYDFLYIHNNKTLNIKGYRIIMFRVSDLKLRKKNLKGILNVTPVIPKAVQIIFRILEKVYFLLVFFFL